jgi:hypothetical protein
MKLAEKMELPGMMKQENGKVPTVKPQMLIMRYSVGILELIRFLLIKVSKNQI